MGQLRLVGPDAAAAFETLMPVDVIDLRAGKQRYGLLLNDEGGILDDLMFFNEGNGSLFVIVNGACKVADIAHIQQQDRQPLPGAAAARPRAARAAGPAGRRHAGAAVARHRALRLHDRRRGADRRHRRLRHPQRLHRRRRLRDLGGRRRRRGAGPPAAGPARGQAHRPGRAQLAAAGSRPVPLRQRHRRPRTTPVEASLNWAIQKVRRTGGAREGGFPGAAKVLAQLDGRQRRRRPPRPRHAEAQARRPGRARAHAGARRHAAANPSRACAIGQVTSGLLGPTVDRPIAMGYVAPAYRRAGHRACRPSCAASRCRWRSRTLPFVPTRYYRG